MSLKTEIPTRKHIERKYLDPYVWRWFFLQPKFWGVWILLFFVWIAGRMPFSIYLRTGKFIGRLLIRIMRKRRFIARCNIELCFPNMTKDDIDVLVRKNFEYAGVALLEPGLMWFSSRQRINRVCRIEGMKHFLQARKEGKTVLLCGMHMQCLEAMGRILGEYITTNHLYRINNNPVYEFFSGHKRSKYPSLSRMIPHKNIRDFIYFMQKGETGSIIPDHDLGRKSSLFVPFMGQIAATVPVVSAYANKTGATVMMMDYFLDENAGQYVLRIHPPLENFPTSDKEADTIRINEIIAGFVREHPAQYLWMHRRFKTRPKRSDPSLYSQKR